VLLGTILFAISIGDGTEALGAWVLLTSILVIGLPHGACDFWLLKERTPDKTSLVGFAKTLAWYTSIATLVAVVWFILPEISLLVFLFLTALHFGSGDEVWASDGEFSTVPAVLRGLMIVSGPIGFHPADSVSVLNALVRTDGTSRFTEGILEYSIYIFIGAAFVLGFYEIYRSMRTKTFAANRIAEPILIGIFFYLVSPLLAVAIYFVAVHSWRHVFRLELYDRPSSDIGEDGLVASFANFYKKALPITVLSLLGLIAVFFVFRSDLSMLSQWTSAYLILLSALTVPHAFLIRKMEKGLGEPLS